MKVIGLTGRIGCGKSTVAAILHDRGVASIDADTVAREVRESDPNARAAILARFGTDDPASLAAVVFRDAGRPARTSRPSSTLRYAIAFEIGSRRSPWPAPVVAAVEAIKLLESPLRDRCDVIWVVDCRPEDAVRRLSQRGMSKAEVRAAVSEPDGEAEEMVKAADVVLDGSAALAVTTRGVGARAGESSRQPRRARRHRRLESVTPKRSPGP